MPPLSTLLPQLEYLLGLALAALCGGLIGLERGRRQKEAGVRTHVVLALGSALMMVVSKYGFYDVVVQQGISLDASRIAANIITGVGFLGAGVIFVRGGSIKGLTTAAGLWTTSGIGLTFGAGMYLVGAAATVLLIGLQLLFHRFAPSFELTSVAELSLTLTEGPGRLSWLRQSLADRGFRLQSLSVQRQEGGPSQVKLTLRYGRGGALDDLSGFCENAPEILSFSLHV